MNWDVDDFRKVFVQELKELMLISASMHVHSVQEYATYVDHVSKKISRPLLNALIE